METTKTTSAKWSLKEIILMALFAALVYLGLQIFRIPVGTQFIHLSNTFILLCGIYLGPVKGSISALTGCILFDLLNGYAFAIPGVILSKIAMVCIASLVFQGLRKLKVNIAVTLVLCSLCGFLANMGVDFIYSTVKLTLLGSPDGSVTLTTAMALAFADLLATGFNLIITSILVPLVYPLFHLAVTKIKQV